jgi:ankyrin repeat protein
MEAARSGSLEAVRLLLAHGADVNARERGRQQTALMWAAARRHAAIVRLLIAHGADLHARTSTRPLTVMLDRGPRRAVKTSMQDARTVERGGSTALLFAAQSGSVDAARQLLAAGASANDTAADGTSAVVMATLSGYPELAAVLLEAGAEPDAAGAGYTALHAAALRGDLHTVKALLAKGANPELPITRGSPVRRFGSQWALPTTLQGATPLIVAAAYVETDIMQALLAAGARADAALADGTSALLIAAGTPIEKEARPSDLARWNIVDSDTPVVPRAEPDVVTAVTLLLDRGANVNDVSLATGDTALHGAAGDDMPAVIQLLVERGASLTARNKDGQTPLDLTLPRPPQGRSAGAPGLPKAEAMLRTLGAR